MRNIIDSIILIITIILISAASVLSENDIFILIYTIFLFILFVLRKRKIDKIYLLFLLAWVVINIASVFYNGDSTFSYYTFIGYIIKFTFPYLTLKVIGDSFFMKFEKIIFGLTLLSIPFFMIEVFVPGLMNIIISLVGKAFTIDVLAENGATYLGVYMFNDLYLRNAGFMWEPGAFAMMIILGMLIHLFINKFEFSWRRIIIYTIALLTTLSTMGFVVILLVYSIILLQKKKLVYFVFLLPILVPYVLFLENADFVGQELTQASNMSETVFVSNSKYVKLNRLGHMLYAVKASIEWPFGNGVLDNKLMASEYGNNVVGVSSLAFILMVWGWFGLFFLVKSIFNFFKGIVLMGLSNTYILIATLAVLGAFFSNPIHKNPILFLVVFYPYIYKSINLNTSEQYSINNRRNRILWKSGSQQIS